MDGQITAVGVVIATVGVLGRLSEKSGYVRKERPMTDRAIEQVQQEHTAEWMAIAGVEGTAIGLLDGEQCIKVFASVKAQELRIKIPSTIEGYPVVIEETGAFGALD